MGLKEVLQEHKVPLPEDFEERFDIVISGLKGKPDYQEKLNAYKAQTQKGGALTDPNDFLTTNLQWIITSLTTPNAQNVLRVLFSILFFVSYLESIPVFGSILSASLDVMTAAVKSLVKASQKALPAMFGLIPLPFMSLVGMIVASIFGLIVWPIVAIVSFSRQDFTAAIDSFIRVIPPPIGDSVADAFLEVNRMTGRLNANRKKLASDISKGFSAIAKAATGVSGQVKQGAESMAKKTEEVAATPAKVLETATKTAETATKTAEKVKEKVATAPEGIMNKMGEAETAVKDMSSKIFLPSVPASEVIKNPIPPGMIKEKVAFPPMPVRAGRKKLSRKPRSKGKWKTRRNKYVKH